MLIVTVNVRNGNVYAVRQVDTSLVSGCIIADAYRGS